MVDKGLKVGDIFVEGGRRYEILAVNKDDTYLSQMTQKEQKLTPRKPRKPKAPTRLAND